VTLWRVSNWTMGNGNRGTTWRRVSMIRRLIDAVRRWRIRREVAGRLRRYVREGKG
jgi:hypothetical protein